MNVCVCSCVCYLDVLLPVELSGSLLWQTTGSVLQWGEHSGGNVDIVALQTQTINDRLWREGACYHMSHNIAVPV